MAKIEVDISSQELDAAVTEALGEWLLGVGTLGKTRAQQIIGEEITDRSGDLHSSIDFEVLRSPSGGISLELFSRDVPYAIYQHEGTGRYGPKKKDIRPTKGKFLMWKDPDTGQLVRARKVKGTPPKKFLSRAIDFALDRMT